MSHVPKDWKDTPSKILDEVIGKLKSPHSIYKKLDRFLNRDMWNYCENLIKGLTLHDALDLAMQLGDFKPFGKWFMGDYGKQVDSLIHAMAEEALRKKIKELAADKQLTAYKEIAAKPKKPRKPRPKKVKKVLMFSDAHLSKRRNLHRD